MKQKERRRRRPASLGSFAFSSNFTFLLFLHPVMHHSQLKLYRLNMISALLTLICVAANRRSATQGKGAPGNQSDGLFVCTRLHASVFDQRIRKCFGVTFAAETRSEILQHETRSEILQETSLLPLLRLLAHLPKCRQCRQESKAPPLVSSLTSAQVLVGPGLPAWVQGWEGHVLVTISQGTITTRAPMSRFVACAACGGICMGVEHVVTEMLHPIHSTPSFTCRRQNLHPKLAEERFN